MTIPKFLKKKDIERIKFHVSKNSTYTLIRRDYPDLDKCEASILFEYFNYLKTYTTSARLGHKEEPYYEGEEYNTSPMYTWEGLSKKEQAFYIRYDKKLKRKEARLLMEKLKQYE